MSKTIIVYFFIAELFLQLFILGVKHYANLSKKKTETEKKTLKQFQQFIVQTRLME